MTSALPPPEDSTPSITTHPESTPSSLSPSTTTTQPPPPKRKTPTGQKPCSICQTPRNVLIRCQIDATQKWHFVCTGKCWNSVSGGKPDGTDDFPHYRYGGMWKNKRADEPVSAKIKGAAKVRNREGAVEGGGKGVETVEKGRFGREGLWRKGDEDVVGLGDGRDDGRDDEVEGDGRDDEGEGDEDGDEGEVELRNGNSRAED